MPRASIRSFSRASSASPSKTRSTETPLEPRLDPSEQVLSRGQLDAVHALVYRNLYDPVRRDPAGQADAQAGADEDRGPAGVVRVLSRISDRVLSAEVGVDLGDQLQLREQRIVQPGVDEELVAHAVALRPASVSAIGG